MEKAFDKVWKDGLKQKLRQHGVSGNMFTWISQYLHNRKARVQLQGQKSRKKLLSPGVPQGAVLSPTLFFISIDDIWESCQEMFMVRYTLTTWCYDARKSTPLAQVRMQETLNKIDAWTKTWLVSVNTIKTTYTVFSLFTKNNKQSWKRMDSS